MVQMTRCSRIQWLVGGRSRIGRIVRCRLLLHLSYLPNLRIRQNGKIIAIMCVAGRANVHEPVQNYKTIPSIQFTVAGIQQFSNHDWLAQFLLRTMDRRTPFFKIYRDSLFDMDGKRRIVDSSVSCCQQYVISWKSGQWLPAVIYLFHCHQYVK
jgi:hypothetical protein